MTRTNSMDNGVQWSACLHGSCSICLPSARLSPCADFSRRRRMVVGMRRVVSSDCRWQGISKTRSATAFRLSLHNVSVETLRPGGTVLRRWRFGSVESSLLRRMAIGHWLHGPSALLLPFSKESKLVSRKKRSVVDKAFNFSHRERLANKKPLSFKTVHIRF